MSNTNNRDLLIFLRENLDSLSLSEFLKKQLLNQPESVTDLEGVDLENLQMSFVEFIA